jgi:TRAP-type mannitol/chloroaromatic compound transport system permease large subunit
MSGTEILAILMLVAFFGLLMAGVPVAITLATAGFVFGFLGFGTTLFNLLPARIYGVVSNYQWLAIPLFVFMGVMLEKSRLAEDLLDVVGHLAGRLRGGMALGIIGVGVLMGATTGIVGATVITLGLLTLPTLIRRGYDPGTACGAICASGTLGQIIPPSLILILLSDILQLSVGTLFAAAVVPGLMLAALYCVLSDPRHGAPADGAADSGRERAPHEPPETLLCASSRRRGAWCCGVAPSPGNCCTTGRVMGALGAILVTAFAGRMRLAVLKDTIRDHAHQRHGLAHLICAQVFPRVSRTQGRDLIHSC